MKGAAATAGMLSAAILLAFVASSAGRAHQPSTASVNSAPAQVADAEFLVNLMADESFKTRIVGWLRDTFPGGVREQVRDSVGLEGRYPGITDFIIREVQATALRDFDQTFDRLKRQLAAWAVAHQRHEDLDPIVAFYRSSIGARLVQFPQRGAMEQGDRAAAEAFVSQLTAEERTELLRTAPPNALYQQIWSQLDHEFQRSLQSYLDELFANFARTEQALIQRFQRRTAAR